MSLIEQLKKKTTTVDLKSASPEDRKQINTGLAAISSKPNNHEIKLSEQVQKQVEEAINASVARS